jgi:hypothetical protein
MIAIFLCFVRLPGGEIGFPPREARSVRETKRPLGGLRRTENVRGISAPGRLQHQNQE